MPRTPDISDVDRAGDGAGDLAGDLADEVDPASAVVGRTELTAEQLVFDAASRAYVPPPAGLIAIIAGFVGSQFLSVALYTVVASAWGLNLLAPGGPAFAAGTAVGQLSAGRGFTPVKSFNDLSLGVAYLLAIPTWLGLALPLVYLAWRYGRGITRLIGLRMRGSDVLIGLPIGIGLQVLAVPVLYWALLKLLPESDVSGPARQLIERASSPVDAVLLIVLVGFCAPVFEEVFYRGLCLRMMERRIGTTYAILASALFFGVAHFQGIQFPGLLLFGVVAGVLTVRTGRLGMAIWAHVGFNLTTVVLILGNFGI